MRTRDKITQPLRSKLHKAVIAAERRYNSLSAAGKKAGLLLFGLVTGGICMLLIAQAITSPSRTKRISIENITLPKDTYMSSDQQLSENNLIPIGKLKGEINGEFEAFYLAVDKDGRTYINRDLVLSAKTYQKSRGWEEISREQLKAYEKELHFLPFKSKGLKR